VPKKRLLGESRELFGETKDARFSLLPTFRHCGEKGEERLKKSGKRPALAGSMETSRVSADMG